MKKYALALVISLFLFTGSICEVKQVKTSAGRLSVAFYNLDNLFDDVNDADHFDDDFTPQGKYGWSRQRYLKKLSNMADVIAVMANGEMPDAFGVCELESGKAFTDLLSTGRLKGKYGIVHYDSPDERGIDVAFAYRKDKLSIVNSEKVGVILSKDLNDRTRDQLYVKSIVSSSGDTLHFYICHFPSRKEGSKSSEINRIDAAKACRGFLDKHVNLLNQNLVIMGDFNDEPWDKSIHEILRANEIGTKDSGNLLNLMWQFREQKRGTYRYKDKMNILDQFIVSASLIDGVGMEYDNQSVNIFDKDWLTQKGKYNGYPLRTFAGTKWLNGYSDHYAIYMNLKL